MRNIVIARPAQKPRIKKTCTGCGDYFTCFKQANYDYSKNINQLIAILEGKANPNSAPTSNKSPNPNVPNQDPNGSGESSGLPSNYPSSGNIPWQPNQPSQSASQLDQQTIILIVGVVLVIFFLMNQKSDHPRHRYDDYY